MLARQTSLVLSPYSKIFDVVVSANHRLRLLKSQIDFSFIRNAKRSRTTIALTTGVMQKTRSVCSSIYSSSACTIFPTVV